MLIDHDEVEYKPRFQEMLKTRIRDELSRHLIRRLDEVWDLAKYEWAVVSVSRRNEPKNAGT